MVEIRLFGNLRYYAKDATPFSGVMVQLEPLPGETVQSLIERLGISPQEINHIFFNSRLIATRNSHAALYDLPQARRDVNDWNLALPIRDHDRVGLFGLDIPMLSM